jgi:cold shock protein
MREKGTVKKWVADRGFGFIRRPHGTDVFFHVSDVAGFERGGVIEEGAEVSFEIQQADKGLRAYSVELV